MIKIIKNKFSKVPENNLYYKVECPICNKWLSFCGSDYRIGLSHNKYIKCLNCYLDIDITEVINKHDEPYRRTMPCF